MRLDLAFRLSTYASLGCAAACLAYAEDKYVPGVGWFGVAAGVLLAIAFFLEGRWALPIAASNALGALIVIGIGAVMFSRLGQPRAEQDTLLSAPWPAALLPYLGPLLMVLMLAKLIRPKEHGDYWVLQVIGLLQITLAAALANDPQDSDLVFGLLLLVYAGCALWWVLLCALRRWQTAPIAGAAAPRVPWRLLGLRQTATWLGTASAVGLVLFLLTPRVSSLQQPFVLHPQQSGGGSSATGYTDTIDLNVTGQVEVNNEVAFEVVASYDRILPRDKPERPKPDLDPEQRWRGASLNFYSKDQARWYRRFPRRPASSGNDLAADASQILQVGQLAALSVEEARFGGLVSLGPGQILSWSHLVRTESNAAPPKLGAHSFFLTYTLYPKRAHGVFLAEPVLLRPRQNVVTVVGESRDDISTFHWELEEDGTPKPTAAPSGTATYYYRQATRPPEEDGVSPAGHLRPDYIARVRTQQPLARLGPWTTKLLGRLASQPRYHLRAADLERDADGLLPRSWEKVTRALADYLANSGEYGYTLDLHRLDLNMDPIEDFLFNVKQGHCERYATALTLMLRSQGIPARVVLGYKGAENRGNGVYYVRQSHAHSWVEALIQRPGRKGPNPEYFWLALDPTPSDDLATAAAGRSFLDWLSDTWRGAQGLWRDFVVGYNIDAQASLNAMFEEYFVTPALAPIGGWSAEDAVVRESRRQALVTVGACVAAVGIVWLVWRRRRRRVPSTALRIPTVAFYARLLALLARHLKLRPDPAQTPLEFAEAAGSVLREALPDPVLAALPARVVSLLYPVRYGLQPLTQAEAQAIDRQLDDMEAGLRACPKKGRSL